MIELSVVVPLFRAKYIAWLAFEGLSRQEGIDFEWELVIAEEVGDEAFLEKNLRGYEEKLKSIGCSRLHYIPLEKWVPLSEKYVKLADNCSQTSKIFASCAADLFPPPKRLKTQYTIFKSDPEVDWCTNARTISYDIASERCYLHDLTGKSVKKKNDGSNRAIRMEIARNLPVVSKKSSVDGWMWQVANKYVSSQGKKFKAYFDESDNWKYGLSVNGLNNISLDRSKRFDEKFIERSPRLKKCPIDINKTIPKDIMDRLRECKKYVELHKVGGPIWR